MTVQRKVAKINTETLKDRIYSELRRALMAGRFAPGEPLTIKMLGQQLGAGLMPVRESVQRLITEGALSAMPNRTIRVPLLSRGEFEELCEIRVAIESLAAARAARLISDEEVKSVAEDAKRLDAAVRRGTPEAILEANIAFHFHVYRAARYGHLLAMIESLWLRNGPLLIYPFQAKAPRRKDFLRAHAHHQEWISALAARDAEKAAETVTKLIRTAQVWYQENYKFAEPGRQLTTKIDDRAAP